MNKSRVLVVDDEKHIRKLVEDILSGDYSVYQAVSGESCIRKLSETGADIVLLDLQLQGMDGIGTLERIKTLYPRMPVVIMTGHGTIEKAVSSMKLGAYDFLTKPFNAERLRITVKNALEASALESEVQTLRSELKDKYELSNIIGQSGVMQEVFRAVEKVVNSEVTVLIQGESGTGKELIARAIHNQSRDRMSNPFVAVNCTALPESLL